MSTLTERVIEKIEIIDLEQPRISSCGSLLVPFNVSLDETIIQDEDIIKFITEKIKSSYPNYNPSHPAIYVENEFTQKIQEELQKNHPLEDKKWKKFTKEGLKNITFTDYLIFVEPCLNNIDKYWKEDKNASLNTYKLGLIPKTKRYSGSAGSNRTEYWGFIVTLYSDGKTVIPNVEVHSATTLRDLIKHKDLGEWQNDPNRWTNDYINNNQDYIKQILQENSLINNNFISNYRKLLEEKRIIKPKEPILQ